MKTRTVCLGLMFAVLSTTVLAREQVISVAPAEVHVQENDTVTLRVSYATGGADATLTGLGLRIHWDSRQIDLTGIEDHLSTGFMGASATQADTADFDGDPLTDSFAVVAWARVENDWPGSEPAALFMTQFQTSSSFSGETSIRFSASSTAAGFSLLASTARVVAASTPPRVDVVRTVAGTADGTLSENEFTQASMTQIAIAFSEPVGETGALNALSFRLFRGPLLEGPPAGTCAQDPGRGTGVPLQPLLYTPEARVVVLATNLGIPLPAGRYRLLVCGSRIRDLNGALLDGNGDGRAGDDFSRSFGVLSTNRLANPNLDEGVAGWIPESTVQAEVGFASQDAGGAPTSGSIRVANLTGSAEPRSISQCVPVSALGRYLLGGRALLAGSGGPEPVTVMTAVTFHGTLDCSGATLLRTQSVPVGGDSSGVFSRLLLHEVRAPGGAQSARVAYTLAPGVGSGARAQFDDQFFYPGTLGGFLLAVANLDANGRDDLIVDTGDDTGLRLLLNNATWRTLHPTSAFSIAVGDLDADGLDEIIADLGGDLGLAILEDPGWRKIRDSGALLLTTGDLDGNGTAEVIADFGPGAGGGVQVFSGSEWRNLRESSARDLEVVDLDGDGKDELVADFGEGMGLQLLDRDSDWIPIYDGSPVALAAGDLEGNGSRLLVGVFDALGESYLASLGENHVWKQIEGVPAGALPAMDRPARVSRRLGEALSRRAAGSVSLAPGKGGAPVHAILTGDLDGNQHDDLVLGFAAAGGLAVRLSRTRWLDLGDLRALNMVAGDLDGDGTQELIIDDGGESGLAVYRQREWIRLPLGEIIGPRR